MTDNDANKPTVTQPTVNQATVNQGNRKRNRFEVLATILLAFAAVATAWSGYQAARWSGREAHNFALADTLHVRATHAGVLKTGF